MTDQEVYQAIQESTNAVFTTMLHLEISPKQPGEETDPQPLNGVMALLGFTGEWVGTGILYCREQFACRLGSAMLMTEITEVTNDVLDGVGEMANMVMGNVKDRLEPLVGTLAMSIPTVVYGRNFHTRTTAQPKWWVYPFGVGPDSFEIRLCLTHKKTP